MGGKLSNILGFLQTRVYLKDPVQTYYSAKLILKKCLYSTYFRYCGSTQVPATDHLTLQCRHDLKPNKFHHLFDL